MAQRSTFAVNSLCDVNTESAAVRLQTDHPVNSYPSKRNAVNGVLFKNKLK